MSFLLVNRTLKLTMHTRITAILDSIDVHNASHEISRCRPVVFVKMMRMPEKIATTIPRHSTLTRPTFSRKLNLMQTMSQNRETYDCKKWLILQKVTDQEFLTQQIGRYINSRAEPQAQVRSFDGERCLVFAYTLLATWSYTRVLQPTKNEWCAWKRVRN